uniref:DNA helicase n=1 Tax=Heterorhabditis bacteriophora TaxID=37862 RepID=A0A1I7X3E8_HETBA
MDNIAGGLVQQIEDVVGVRIQAEFTRFINEFCDENGEKIYKKAIGDLIQPERNTLYVDMRHVHNHSVTLYEPIEMHFYRLYPFICEALHLATIDNCTDDGERQRMHKKELYVSFTNLENKCAETQAELPRGSIPRTFDVIVRGEMVETVQPGDKCFLTGTLIVIPDIAQMSSPGWVFIVTSKLCNSFIFIDSSSLVAKISHMKITVEEFCPRAIYTSGKASSAAGLTAAVVKVR